MLERYLDMLKDSLESKCRILDSIMEADARQSEILRTDPFDMDAFDRMVDEKDAYIDKMNSLDEGFQNLYDKIKEGLQQEKDKYANQISNLQTLIRSVSDKTVKIQTEEARNRAALEHVYRDEHKKYRSQKDNSKVAYSYYENMNKLHVNTPQYLDSKK